MARRKAKPTADKKMIIEAFAEMARDKNMDRDLLQGIVEETLSMMVRKKYGQDANFEIIVNMEKGDLEIYLMREIVEEVENPELQISMEEVQKIGDIEEEYEIGDEFIEEISLANISENFGRRIVSLGIQALNQRIRDVEKDNMFNEYAAKQGEIIIGEVYQIRRSDLLVVHNKIEMRLPREEQIPNERYKKNQSIKAIVKEVRRAGGSSGMPDVILSRGAEEFLARLFEVEIPEIYDGIIEIKSIAREPGERAKVAVVSYDERVDPVGACVGMKGIRIHSIVRELNNENIDVIEYAENPSEFIKRALAPAKVKDIQLFPDVRSATVVVPDDQVSLAVGRNGQNVRLASKLTGFSITLIKESGEDIELIEFREEIGRQMYEDIIDLGIDTAREFLDADPRELLKVPGMTKEFLIDLRRIILEEFDEKERPGMINRINAIDLDEEEGDAAGNTAESGQPEEAPKDEQDFNR
jgi:N utilization substance protein A